VVGLGLDGASFTLVETMIKEGELPNLSKLSSDGSLLQMDSSVPPVSGVAWASLFTGENPGEFGVFGFDERDEGSYGTHIPNRESLASDTLYTTMDRAGLSYVSINVPMTHPPSASDPSVMVSSFLCPTLEQSASSHKVLQELRKVGYVLDLDPREMSLPADRLFGRIREIYLRREAAMLHFLRTRKCDLFLGVFTESDRLSHLAYDDSKGGPVRELYRLFDATVGRLRKEIPPETPLLVFSDHGFCKAEEELYLNRWLVEEGHLRVGDPGLGLKAIKAGSVAYGMDSGRIYVNMRSREPLGCVERGEEYDSLVKDLADGLRRIRGRQGKRVIRRVWHRDEVYEGRFLSRAPDLLVEAEDGIDVKPGLRATELFGPARIAGMHTGHDAVLASSKALEMGRPCVQDCFGLLMSPLTGNPAP
jgi:predicted AlkP superfamily phosphohydrolase/phosphomutase